MVNQVKHSIHSVTSLALYRSYSTTKLYLILFEALLLALSKL